MYKLLIFALLTACSTQPKHGLKVAASAVPHSEMLEFVKPDLKAQGIDLVIIVTDDYNMPNRALANGEIDANFFQHTPFMESQIQEFHYPIASIASIEIEPMGIYSNKIKSLNDLSDNTSIAVPNDPTNEGRALLLLQENGIIKLDNPSNLQATIRNISENPKHISFIEVDAAMLPRTLDDVDAAVINTNYALQAKLSPIALEKPNSPYANILVVKIADENRPDIQALKSAMTSEKMRAFIQEKYKGALIPAF